jgi:methylaspartate mutase sigma subunit
MTQGGTPRPPTLVLGVIGSDVHCIGNQILEHALREAGFRTVNLGVWTTQEDFIKAAIETAADGILVSSLYGHGEIDAKGLRDKCVEAGLEGIRLYIGGNLVVGQLPWDEVQRKFEKFGFDWVAPPGTMPEDVVTRLRHDLEGVQP